MKRIRPEWILGAAMAVFGTIAVFVRHIEVSSAELALYRAVMASVLIALFLLLTGNRIPWGKIKKAVPLLLASGAAMGFNWILLFEAYRYTTVSTATLSYYFAPVLMTLGSAVLFREKLSARQIVCFVMATVGIVLVTGIGELSGGQDGIGILCGLGAAVLYASVILINKCIRDVDGIHRTLLQFIAAAIVLLPYVLATEGINLGQLNGIGWLNLAIVGCLHTGMCYCLYFTALKDISGQKAAILSYIDPLVAVGISVTLLGEPMTWVQGIGALMILGFTLLNEISPKQGIQ